MPHLIPHFAHLIVQLIGHYAHLVVHMYELCYDYSYRVQCSNQVTSHQVQLTCVQRLKNPASSISMSL